MRHASALLLVTMALAPTTTSASPATGFPALADCSDLASGTGAELYVLKISATPTQRSHDWLWNVDEKTENASDSQALLSLQGFWSVGDVWAVPQSGSDAAFAYVTYPDGRLAADSSDGASVDWGVVPVQRIGDSLPVGRDAGIGLELPSTPEQHAVTLRPGVTRMFPIATMSGSLNLAFAPIAEVNANDAVAGTCQIGGQSFNPRDTTRGAIIGYNVYRLPPCGCTPSRADFHRAMLTDDDSDGGWISFIDLRTFDVTASDGTPGGPGTTAPSDLAPDDLVGLQNADGRMYSGDEVLLFSDMENITRPRSGELAPQRSLSYWYALQPVVYGTVSSFASTGFTVNDNGTGDHRMDLDQDGELDAVSLNTVAGAHDTPEFYSPQAEAENGGQDGLGLTNHGMALLTGCFFMDETWPLPATGQMSLTATSDGRDVSLNLVTGMEPSSVLGYHLHRLVGLRRVRVNEQPILAQGGESNVYALVDAAARARGAKALVYVVEMIPADGTASTFSQPFTLPLDAAAARRRR